MIRTRRKFSRAKSSAEWKAEEKNLMVFLNYLKRTIIDFQV